MVQMMNGSILEKYNMKQFRIDLGYFGGIIYQLKFELQTEMELNFQFIFPV